MSPYRRSTSEAPAPRARGRCGMVSVLSFASMLFSVLAAAPSAAASEAGAVRVIAPDGRQAVFGEVRVEAEVEAPQAVRLVEFYLDGQLAARDTEAPWEVRLDVGQRNVDHVFRVVAVDVRGGRSEAQVTTPRIQVDDEIDVSLLQLYVSVTGRGEPVAGLREPDFQVRSDAGQEQVITFEGGDLPVSAVLLLDTSESMEGAALEGAMTGAESFLRQTLPADESMVALFSDRLLQATAFLGGGQGLGGMLDGISATGGSAVYDALYYALNRVEARLGRRVIVLLSDGLDVSSALDMHDIVWRLRRSQAVLYWLRLGEGEQERGYASSWRPVETNREQLELLELAVDESGGREIRVLDPSAIEDAFGTVLEELRAQYVIGIQPSDRRHDGSWRPLRVRVRGGHKVQTRAGFVD